MGNRIKKKTGIKILFSLVCAIAFITANSGSLKAVASESFEIEQVQACMPDITVYVRSEEQPEQADIETSLGEETLRVDSVTEFAQRGEAIDFFVLVDVSNSIPDSYCQSVKSALKEFSEGLGDEDKMILLSFGEDVTTLLEGGETQEQREQAIEQLHNKDNKTLLFEAIFQTADMADKLQDNARKIVLVISDGEDFAVGASTSQEAVNALSIRNMPLYAMGISDSKKENLNEFGEVARSLGGTLTVFEPGETASTLEGLKDIWNHTWVIELTAGSNRVNNTLNTLSMKLISLGVTRTREVMLSSYIPDNVAPEIVAVEKQGDKQLAVTFSEQITGAEIGTAWSVEWREENLPVTTAVYSDKENVKVLLTFETQLYAGAYRIAAPGVADESMEKNVVANVWEGELEGLEPEVEEELPAWQVWFQSWGWIIPVAVVLILLAVMLVIWRNVKKHRGIIYVDGKASLVKNVEERQHVAITREEGLPITLELLGADQGSQKKITAKVCGSMIVGRASICDLSLEDGRLSRQHFVLEYKDGDLFIMDLQTTNGTAVNGVMIHGTHKLKQRDVITAGSLQLRINW